MPNSSYYLGCDIGSSKTHVVIVDQHGKVAGFGAGGAGNHEVVGYEGLTSAVAAACAQACASTGISLDQVTGAGFGVSGYDWASEKPPTIAAIRAAGVTGLVEAVNDTILGLLAGSKEGWGLAVVSGSGCNCRGWDREHRREGMVTGHGFFMGEGAGGSELVWKAVQSVSHEWTRRGPATVLSRMFISMVGATDLGDLIEGITQERYRISASAAPLIFQAAAQGDAIAAGLIHWAGCELGELANAVIRQLSFENLTFDVVLIGGLFKGGPALLEPMQAVIHGLAPGARFKPLTTLPVVGAVLLGMEQSGLNPSADLRCRLMESVQSLSI